MNDKYVSSTTELIIESARSGRYILVPTSSDASNIVNMALRMDPPVKIPYPVTVSEVMNGRAKGTSIMYDGLLVDNSKSVLTHLLGINVVGMT